ncbi:hypothetical protein [Mesorhizobium sp. WSM2561]|uniref:hypothetical protein n=1 Tax=Mesorhizobium sp. WSM2561 TaxID=1040985 RepID=UPI0004879248|nr:hypothetical protein [Mesorhizobium sp. WSM2561]
MTIAQNKAAELVLLTATADEAVIALVEAMSPSPRSVAFSPDGARLATGSSAGNFARATVLSATTVTPGHTNSDIVYLT